MRSGDLGISRARIEEGRSEPSPASRGIEGRHHPVTPQCGLAHAALPSTTVI
jgi:hypothetical protein